MTYVPKIYLPDKEKFKAYIDGIYENGWLTNNGPLLQKLEKRLEEQFGVKNLLCVSSGTSALQLAYRALEIKGEVITTPFSFVSTTSAIAAEGLTPVFADIDINSYNLDPKNIESVITDKTCAIAPCHVFGNACEIDTIDKIAQKYNLKVIYDASHAFDVQYKDKHILDYGDFAAISFHATKIFHTIEGGALVIKDDNLYKKAKIIRDLGMDGPDSIAMLGINVKMNEVEAAMGLCMLDEMDHIIEEREKSHKYYTEQLSKYVQLQKINKDATQSHTYFPIVFRSENEMETVRDVLLKEEIAVRQYFKTSLDMLPYVELRNIMTKSRDLASRILVIPMHSGIESKVSQIIIETLKKYAHRDI